MDPDWNIFFKNDIWHFSFNSFSCVISSPETSFGGGRFQLRATGEEAKKYDFALARGQRKTTNVVESIGHLIKSCLGGGVVAMHESYKDCGLWTAMVLNVILGVAVTYCMWMLAHSAQRMYGRAQVPTMTYPDLAECSLAIGPWQKLKKFAKTFRYIVDVVVIIDLFGACCVYQVVVARAIKQLVDGSENVDDGGHPPIRVYIVMLLLPCILLCMITTLKYLAPFSLLADLFIFTVAVATVYYGMKTNTQSPLDMPIYKSIPGVFEFIGVCVFSMEGIGATLAIENNMTQPKKIALVLFAGMSFVLGMVMVVGFFGYWGFGENSVSPITVNFPWEPFPIMLKVFMALMIYVTFALNFWIPFELIWFYLKRHYDESRFWLWERVYRAIFVFFITLIAFIFPNVSKFMGLIGSFCLSNMGFVFPAIIELAIEWDDPGLGLMYWRLWKAVIIILFGLILCVMGTYTNSKELIMDVFVRYDTAVW